jgi:hypothetical protein
MVARTALAANAAPQSGDGTADRSDFRRIFAREARNNHEDTKITKATKLTVIFVHFVSSW